MMTGMALVNLTCRSRFHAKCISNNALNNIRCLTSAGLQNIALANITTNTDTKKFYKFKSKMLAQIKQADKSVLLTMKSVLAEPNIEALKKTNEYCALVEKLHRHNGNVISIKPLTNCQYLVEFEKGCIPYEWKLKGPHITRKKKEIKPAVFHGKDLTSCIKALHRTQKLSDEAYLACFYVASFIRSRLRQIDINKNRSLILDNIQIPEQTHKGAMILPFGSTASGLGLRGRADLDIVWINPGENSKDTDSYRDDLQAAFQKMRNYREFRRMLSIVHAKTPILKFQFEPLGIQCDLSRGLINGPLMSEILFWLNEYDDRFYPLLMAVRLLLKVHNVSGSSGPEMTSNTITMLTVAFLQQHQILPPLKEVFDFQLKLDSQWQTTYLTPCTPKPKTLRDNACLGDLFQQFLVFYNNLNFREVIIDVYSGDVQPVQPARHQAMTLINPFDFSHNMSKNVQWKNLKQFQGLCWQVLTRIAKTEGDEFHRLWRHQFGIK